MQTITDEQALCALLRMNFAFFLEFVFAELNGGKPLQRNWHLDAIEHQLDRVRDGKLKRLIITMPPRHLKSITVSVAWVAWMLGKDPSKRFMCVSYGEGLATKHASDCLRIMMSDWYRRAFPGTQLIRRGVLDFETSKGGGRFSASVAGGITGRGADIIILDDPMKADDAMSEHAREQIAKTLSVTLTQRADDAERGVFILVMQRLHEADIAGELIAKGGWHELRLPAITVEDELIPLTDGRSHQRRAGCVLHPERRSKAFLMSRRADDSYVFAAQYQQDPVAPIGAFINAADFGTYDYPPKAGIIVLSLDTAVKKEVRNDFSVGIIAIYYLARFYILDVFREKMSYLELLEQVRSSCKKFSVQHLLIEDASSGSQLNSHLREQPVPGVPRPIAITPIANKITRFEAQASKIQSGNVVLPQSAPWLADFVKELVSFPGVGHDDQVDALAQMLANPPKERPRITNAGPELFVDGQPTGGPGKYEKKQPFDRTYGRLRYEDDDNPWLTP